MAKGKKKRYRNKIEEEREKKKREYLGKWKIKNVHIKRNE